MKKYIVIPLLILSISQSVIAEQVDYLNKKSASMDAKSRKAVQLADRWINRRVMPHSQERDGAVTFTFGATRPTIICKPLHVCTLRLQTGESIIDAHTGDGARWKIIPSPPHQNVAPHVIIKPLDSNLITNLMLLTDKRTYVIELRSRRDKHMPLTAFRYPHDDKIAWKKYYDAKQAEKAQEKQINQYNNALTAGSNQFDARRLNFNYSINGQAEWKPVRVFNDGRKTYIQMKKDMFVTEAPILMSLDNNTQGIVNYRVDGDTYIVDRLFNRASLLAGVGKNRKQIVIQRVVKKGQNNYSFNSGGGNK